MFLHWENYSTAFVFKTFISALLIFSRVYSSIWSNPSLYILFMLFYILFSYTVPFALNIRIYFRCPLHAPEKNFSYIIIHKIYPYIFFLLINICLNNEKIIVENN